MCGFGGAGAFSDGKFNFTTAFGGWLTDFLDQKEVMDLIGYVDSLNVKHGATTEVYSTATPQARALELSDKIRDMASKPDARLQAYADMMKAAQDGGNLSLF